MPFDNVPQLIQLLPGGTTPGDIALLSAVLGVSAVMSGLSGFGFSAIGAICLLNLPPASAVPLLMALSTANQMMSLGQLKTELPPLKAWWPNGPTPYLLGGAAGVPIGLWILQSLPTQALMAVFGAFLVAYAVYSMLKPAGLRIPDTGGWPILAAVGMAGGLIGGFTAFPGAAVVVWSGLRQLPKREARAIVQPYILAMQLLSLALLAINRPAMFGAAFWTLLALMLPVVLPGTLIGVRLYRSLSDINFRRVAFMLLGTSGAGLLAKGLSGGVLLSALGRLVLGLNAVFQ